MIVKENRIDTDLFYKLFLIYFMFGKIHISNQEITI